MCPLDTNRWSNLCFLTIEESPRNPEKATTFLLCCIADSKYHKQGLHHLELWFVFVWMKFLLFCFVFLLNIVLLCIT